MVAEIVITHGVFVDEMSNMVGIPIKEWCDYCAITAYTLTEIKTGEIITECLMS